MDSIAAELLLLRKRTAAWILLGAWSVTAMLFSYLFPYLSYTSGVVFHQRDVGQILLDALLPQNLVANILGAFPFFGGTMVLILGALAIGSEFSWGTLTPVFTQGASRLRVFFSKMLALGIALVPFVLLVFMLGFVASLLIAVREGQPIDWPPLWEVVRAMGVSWFILATWASLGVVLAALSRGTALAIGLGIIYGLVLEGVITIFGKQVDFLGQVSTAFLRTNGYSLVSALGVTIQGEMGPGGFSGPFVSGTQASLVMAGYIVLFIGAAAALIRMRDVAGAS